MRFSKFISVALLAFPFAWAGWTGGLLGQSSPHPILPATFGGWQASGSPATSTDPAIADAVNTTVLQEYGFRDFQAATYTREDGRKLRLKAARFADASGAFGAFTFYKTPQMLVEKIGDQAASLNERVLFYRGNILIDAVFERLSAMSAAELRELVANLPLPAGETRNLPGLPAYLPRPSYIKNSAKYVLGPVTLERVKSPLPAELVDFSRGAEVVLGNYNASGGEATLMLISYPTPQIAADNLRKIQAAYPPNPPPSPGSRGDVQPMYEKRTGPIVVVAQGPLSLSEAKSLLALINYDADVTWNENTLFTKKDNLANLLVNVIILCFIIGGFALAVGIAFGGIRILTKRIFPDRVFDRPQDVEFISLHLSENRSEPTQANVSPSIKAI
ncbi:MAG TPA: DUF6599 family protein [Terriglobales bacterium]|nr:DUF6599 family protein [Terriglobales bacterium]